MTAERDMATLEGIQIKREDPIPRTRHGNERKSFVYFDDPNGIERSLLTRIVENNREIKPEIACVPALIGFDFGRTLTNSETYLTAIQILRDRGFNVVPDVWKIDEQKVATTNLVEFGGSVYDQKIDSVLERDTLPMDREFIKLSMRDVQKAAWKIAELANKTGVELMTDGPFHIVVRPDRSWYLSFLDIGKVRIHSNFKDIDKEYRGLNQRRIDDAIYLFVKAQENIKTLKDARGLV